MKLTKGQCVLIYEALNIYGMNADMYEFGLPNLEHVEGGEEGIEEIINKILEETVDA